MEWKSIGLTASFCGAIICFIVAMIPPIAKSLRNQVGFFGVSATLFAIWVAIALSASPVPKPDTSNDTNLPSQQPLAEPDPSTPDPKNTTYSIAKLAGIWEGKYVGCGQSETGLTLTVIVTGETTANVNFHFYSISGSTMEFNGDYLAYGSFNPDNGIINIQPVRWVNQPLGFTAVPMTGSYDADTERFTGQIINCGPFDLYHPQ